MPLAISQPRGFEAAQKSKIQLEAVYKTSLVELDSNGQVKAETPVCNKTIFLRNIIAKIIEVSHFNLLVDGEDIVNNEASANGITGLVSAVKKLSIESNDEAEWKIINWFFVELLNSNATPIEESV